MKLDIQLFSSTNKTEYYELSQYVASDKPTYLVDYNDDMSAIDTAIHGAKTQADLGVANAGIAQTTAENAQTTANTAVTNASTAQTTADSNTSKIGNLANLSTVNKSDLVSAITEVKNENITQNQNIEKNTNNIANFNLTSFETINYQNITRTGNGNLVSASNVYVAKNSDGSLAKIYGTIILGGVTQNGNITFQTSLRPSESLTIDSHVILATASDISPGIRNISSPAMTISTTGLVTIPYRYTVSGDDVRIFLHNSLLFIKDFGDIGIQE